MTAKTIGFIGGGRIARVFLGGWRKAGAMPAKVVVSDIDPQALTRIKESFGTVEIRASHLRRAARS